MSTSGYEFASRVAIRLLINGIEVSVDQTGGEYLMTSHPFDVPAGQGTLVLSIDDRQERFEVYLPEGIRADRLEQPLMMR